MAATEVVDLDTVVIQWAKTMFDTTKTKEQAKIHKDNLTFTINWNRVKVIHGDPDYDEKLHQSRPKSQLLFRTYFTNETDQEQEYSFMTERMTTSTCEVQLERAVTRGGNVGLTLKTPLEILEVNAGFHREVNVTEAQGYEVEQAVKWAVDNEIKVPAQSKTSAELIVTEAHLSTNFKVTSTVAGRVLVKVTNRKDNSLITTIEGNIAEIIKREMENGLKGFHVENNVIKYETRGQTKFKYAVEQIVKLKEKAL